MDILHRWVSILAAGQLAPKCYAKPRGVSQLACIAAAACLAGCEGTFGPWELDGAVQDPEWSAANCGLAIQGEYAAVCGEDEAHHRSVTVFRKDSRAERWVLLQRIAPRPGAPEAKFGEALAMDHGRLAIGAVLPSRPGSHPAGESLGYVDIYRLGAHGARTDYGYEKTVEAFSDEPEENGYTVFASTLALEASTLIVGARFANNGLGSAFVFDLNTNDPPEVLDELAGDPTDYHFGTAVDVAAGRLAVSTEGACHSPCPVFVYHRDAAGDWIPEQVSSPEIPTDPNEAHNYRFGQALVLSSNWLAVADNDSKVHFFRRSGETWLHETTYEISVVRREQFAGDGNLIAIADQITRSGASSPASRLRVFRITATGIDLEGQTVFPTTEFASHIDASAKNLIVSHDPKQPPPPAEPRRPSPLIFVGP
jgi:hypothetical protein